MTYVLKTVKSNHPISKNDFFNKMEAHTVPALMFLNQSCFHTFEYSLESSSGGQTDGPPSENTPQAGFKWV